MKPKKQQWARTAYGEKLQDPRWQKMRLQVMERDEFTCQLCGDDKSMLNVHHLWYGRDRDPWDYPLTALLTLCGQCHEAETDALRPSTDYLVHVLKTAGAMSFDFDLLSDIFPPRFIQSSAMLDHWAVIIFGFCMVLRAHDENGDAWRQLSTTYYENLAARKEEEGASPVGGA